MTVFIKFIMLVYFVPVILLSILIYPTDIHGRNYMYRDAHCRLTAVES